MFSSEILDPGPDTWDQMSRPWWIVECMGYLSHHSHGSNKVIISNRVFSAKKAVSIYAMNKEKKITVKEVH